MLQNNSNQRKYISLTEATKHCDYTQEYLSLRARQGKLKAKKFGRNWVTTKEWVEEYFDKTNSSQARAQEKKANGLLFSYDSISRASKRFSAEFGKAINRPELRYAIASVLIFIFLGAGFVWGAPTLLSAKDSFVEGLAVFSEEVNKGVSKFSQDAVQVSDTMRGIVKVPSVSIPSVPTISIPIVNIPPAPQLSIPNIPPVPTINIPSFANFSGAMRKNFSSTTAGARGVAQNFRDGKDFVVDGVENIAVGIANAPVEIARKVLDIRFPKSEIGYQEIEYGLGYTGEMFGEYTQWLDHTFVQIHVRGVAENMSAATASITGSGASFYNKYLVANDWVEDKIEKVAIIPSKLSNIFSGAPNLAKQETPEPQQQEQEQEQEQEPEQEIEETAKEFAETGDMEKLQQRIKELEARGYQQKEVIKEVKKITQIQPVQKITKQTQVIDSKALLTLATLEDRIDDIEKWEKDIRALQNITKKLQANPPTTAASTAPIYIGSQGIQVGGAGIFSSLGVSGSAGLSNLGVGGDTALGGTSGDKLTVNASSQFNAPIIVSSSVSQTGGFTLTGALTHTGDLTRTGTSTFTGVVTQSGGDVSFGGDVVISGGLTVGGTGTAGFTASSTSAALSATQTGSGPAAEFGDGTDYFQISNAGNIVFVNADGGASITGSAGGSFGITAGTSQALNLTGNAASIWKTSSGNLTIQSAGTFTATSTGDMIFGVKDVERMRILASNGYVGIATSTPAYFLDVWGDARFGTSTDGALFVDASTKRIGIGTTTPSATLEVVGNIVGSGNITVAGQAVFNRVPSLPHQFDAWTTTTDIVSSRVFDATVYINSQTHVQDSNILGIAVNDLVKFLVDAEGDVFVNSLTSTGSVNVGATTISTLTVENNTILGDASSDKITAVARFGSSLIPSDGDTYDLGSASNRWQDIYAVTGHFSKLQTPYAQTKTVAASGGDYTSVQDAIDSLTCSASAPCLVRVMPGVYAEQITINDKSYIDVISSAGPEATKIAPASVTQAIVISGTSGNVRVKGFTIEISE